MELIAQQVGSYLEQNVPARPAIMQEMEARAARDGFPIIGPAAGYFCYQIARMSGARRVFELGSGYGYSTAWFARAVRENGGGEVHHVVWDEALSVSAKEYLSKLGLGDLVRYTVSEAVAALRQADGPFDLVFNDIEKAGYPASLPVIADKLRRGGVLITDNVLWSGRIFDDADQSPATEGVRAYTHAIMTSEDWIGSIVPIRDGVLLAYRR